jgi:lysophospholipase L1-like esterase
VMSAGVAGSDPFFGYMVLRDKLLMFQPDLVTLTINGSDFNDVIFRGGKERFASDGSLQYAAPPADEGIYEASHFYRFIKMGVLGYDWLQMRAPERKRRTLEAASQLTEAIADFQNLALEEGFAFVVILHPMFHELRKNLYDDGFEEIISFLKEKGIHYVDLLSYYHESLEKSGEQPSEFYWKIDGHHNARGYALFAEGLEAYLRAHDMIPGRAASIAPPGAPGVRAG